MKTIDIPTAHNIIITHELASVTQRVLAFVIDGIVLIIYTGLIISVFGTEGTASYILLSLPFLTYHLCCEIFYRGQSLGKKVLHLRVVSIHGLTPTFSDYILRWVFRLLDITLSGGSLAVISILTSPHSQRIGDILGRTAVVNLRASELVDLGSIHNLNQKIKEVIYPQVVRYSDKDMLLVKHILQRYRESPNPANSQILQEIAKRLAGELKVDYVPSQATDFLKKILTDYIVITR